MCESLFGKQYIDDILAVEQRTQVDHTASSTSFHSAPDLTQFKYGLLLKLLSNIEGEMHAKVEFYDNYWKESSKSIKSKQRWDKCLGDADEELKLRLYFQAKQREKDA